MARRDPEVVEFQRANCPGCTFADDSLVGTGIPCCTEPLNIEAKDRICLTRKEKELVNA
jgi:hypothetical protein